MTLVGMIPARMGSSRFPGKPLALLGGIPMIEHVYRRTAMCKALSAVYVATCDEEIYNAVRKFGGKAIMTSDRHERASERIAEAMQSVPGDIVVMVQGDEPMVTPSMIDQALAPMLRDETINCVNLTKRIDDESEFLNPNTIKVVIGKNGQALYMSRQPIPDRQKRAFSEIVAYKQVCIMPFRRKSLEHFVGLAPTPLEIAESIDMLRFIENGVPVHLIETDIATQAVDTASDLALVEKLMRTDPLIRTYAMIDGASE